MSRVLITLAIMATSHLSSTQDLAPTWSEDIACLVYTYCTGCHNTNGVAPFPLETYEQVEQLKVLIYHEIIVEGRMPPYPASTPTHLFADNISLKDDEKELFKEWLEDGLAIGNEANAPEAPVIESNIMIENPNFVVQMEPYRVPENSGTDQYRCFVFPVDFEKDMYIKEIEFIAENPKAVHHILLYHDTGQTAINLDAADPKEGYTCFGGIGTNNARLLGGWAPGGQPAIYTHGMEVKIPKNTNLVVQLHYPQYAGGEVDASRIHMTLTDEPQREIRVDPILYHFPPGLVDGPIDVPPNEIRTYHQEFEWPGKVMITSVSPHAHLICTHLETWAEKPDGSIQELITIPNWDFEWQYNYPYKKPIVLEAITVLKSIGIYDNTVNNPNNPSIPPQQVTLGEATGDEMFLFFFSWSPYEEGDEDILLSEKDHIPFYNDCRSAVLTGDEEPELLNVELFPNPAKNFVIIESDTNFDKVTLYDVLGNVVLRKSGSDIKSIDIKNLTDGSYVIQLKSNGSILSKNLII